MKNSTSTRCGTPDYVAPEVIKGLPYDRNVDWWSFGVLVFELTVGVVPFFSQSTMEKFQMICNAPLRFPSWMEHDCQDLIESLLERTVPQRLGYQHDVEDIKGHQWFDKVDWNKLMKKEVVPPFRPRIFSLDSDIITPQNVAKRYLREAPVDSFAPIPNVDMFNGFSFAVDAEVTETAKESSESNDANVVVNVPRPGVMDGFCFTDTGYLSTEGRSSSSAVSTSAVREQ